MKQEELNEILKQHNLWLSKNGGNKADLRRANLHGAYLQEANLREVDLRWARLQGADLRGADLRWADLCGADLRGADLQGANLQEVNLQEVNLLGADLRGVDLRGADLQGADFDFSCLPLWCGGLHLQFDDKQITQLVYHLLSAAEASKKVSQELKNKLLTTELIEIANKFHRVEECGKIRGDI